MGQSKLYFEEHNRSDLLADVIKTCRYSLTIMEEDGLNSVEMTESDKNLHKMVNNYVFNNLGVGIDTYAEVECVLYNIQRLYKERCEKIKENGLDELEEKLYGLDRNKDEI